MNITSLAISKKTLTYFCTSLLIIAGIASYFQLGQLEDPEFTIKIALITTLYPGASPETVELEVTDPIEKAIQKMHQVKNVWSYSREGLSMIKVEIKEEYWSDRLPQVWDELRKKIKDMSMLLPPGTTTPVVTDDFSDVYGFVLALTGDGYSYKELEEYAEAIKKELNLVNGVARVELWGIQDKVIYIDLSEEQLTQLGITAESFVATLSQQNMVVDAGYMDFQGQRLRIEPTGEFNTPEEIGELAVRSSLADMLLNLEPIVSDVIESQRGYQLPGESSRRSELIRVKDLATVSSGYLDPPRWEMRYQGQPAIAIYISNSLGGNVVKLGEALNERIEEIMSELPVGVELHRVAWQADLVSKSINDFLINLTEAILIVMIVLWISMGFRMAIIIGIGGVLITIIGTFIFMNMFDIVLHRVSLGALIIALGMMVDNAIVVADGISVRIQNGMDRTQAAIEGATQPGWALLGATVIAVFAFYPIFGSVAATGEVGRSLFQVVAISLLLSWVLALTIIPLMCIGMLPVPDKSAEGADPYGGGLFQLFRKTLARVIKLRLPFLGVMVGLLLLSIFGFGYVNILFFPNSSRPQLMVDYWAPEGTRIQQVSEDLKPIEEKLMQSPYVKNVSTFMGQGPPRFYLPVEPELPYSTYAQIVINAESFDDILKLADEMEPWLAENYPQALTRVRNYSVGPSDTWKLSARFSGPANADPATLRSLANQGVEILKNSPYAKEVRTNWRQRKKKIVPKYDQERARWAAVSRLDVARATKWAHDGLVVGLYREGDDMYPIMVRQPEDQRQKALENLELLQVLPSLSTDTIPLSQVTDGIEIQWEDPIIHRWDRRRAITVEASPNGVTYSNLHKEIEKDFEAIELPPGYTLEWDGEYESINTSIEQLGPAIPIALVIMALILVGLFNALRPPLIIVCVIPFAIIGITFGLLLTGVQFGYMALIGAMSLAGMMTKNSIVLLDQIKIEKDSGKDVYNAVLEASVSRLRPVVNASATTILGLAPLLQDEFWQAMSVAIMFGLAFGTILTMLVVPVLYTVFYRIKSPDTG